MDIGKSINAAENSLRDLIAKVLEKKFGEGWIDKVGLTEKKITEWKNRLSEELNRRPGGTTDRRILYYSDFSDIAEIIKKNWEYGFKNCFGNIKKFDVYTSRIAAFRNPDAHSRDLLPFEEHLVLGMTGEIRQVITIFLSRGAGADEMEHFPRIEEVRDNFGLRVTGGALQDKVYNIAESEVILRPGDEVNFLGKAWDPENRMLIWHIHRHVRKEIYTYSGPDLDWTWAIEEGDIAQRSYVRIDISSDRSYHRNNDGKDDSVMFMYKILPLVPAA